MQRGIYAVLAVVACTLIIAPTPARANETIPEWATITLAHDPQTLELVAVARRFWADRGFSTCQAVRTLWASYLSNGAHAAGWACTIWLNEWWLPGYRDTTRTLGRRDQVAWLADECAIFVHEMAHAQGVMPEQPRPDDPYHDVRPDQILSQPHGATPGECWTWARSEYAERVPVRRGPRGEPGARRVRWACRSGLAGRAHHKLKPAERCRRSRARR